MASELELALDERHRTASIEVSGDRIIWYASPKRAGRMLVAALVVVSAATGFVGWQKQMWSMAAACFALVLPVLAWYFVPLIRRRQPLVTVSGDGLWPHHCARSFIPWPEITGTRLDRQGVHTLVRIETTRSPQVREALRWSVRRFGWLTRLLGSGEVTVSLTLMDEPSRAAFLAVLDQLDRGP